MLYTEIKRKTKEVKELTKLGLINPNWLRDIEIFEQFHFYISEGNNKQDSYVLCSEDFNIGSESVKKIVVKLSKN
jgi:hypothetical protein